LTYRLVEQRGFPTPGLSKRGT